MIEYGIILKNKAIHMAQKNIKTILKLFTLSAVVFTALVFVILFATSVSAALNPNCANGTTMTANEFNTAKAAGKVTVTQTSQSNQIIYHINNTTGCSAPLIAASYKVFIQPSNP